MRGFLRWVWWRLGTELPCPHPAWAEERIYGDAINLLGCRAVRTCRACGWARRSEIL